MSALRVLWGAFLLALALPATADDWWIETTQADFADGSFDASLYAAGIGIAGDGAVQLIHLRDIDTDDTVDLMISNSRQADTLSPAHAYHSYLFDGSSLVDSLFGYNASGNLICDYDNDGNLDIILVAFDDSTGNGLLYSHLYYGPDFSTVDSFYTQWGTAVSAADLDNDGDLDLVFSNLAGYAYIYYQGEAARDSVACDLNYSNTVADANDDGNLDIILAGEQGIIYHGPDFTGTFNLLGIDSLTDITVADLNFDGDIDIVAAAQGDSSCIFWGPGFNNPEKLYTPFARGVSIDNLNEDEDLDIVFSTLASVGLIYFGPDYTSTPFLALPTHVSLGNVVGDFNGDRQKDICFYNYLEGDQYDTYSYIYLGPDFMSLVYDSLPAHGANMGTTSDAGNTQDRSEQEVYISSVYDNLDTTYWDSVTYIVNMPAPSCDFFLEVQTGNVPDPDTSWSDWLIVSSGDILPDSLASRYIRYRATLISDFHQGPVLEEVAISYPSQLDVAPDSIISPAAEEVTDCDNRVFLFQVANLGPDTVSFPVHCLLDSSGVILVDSILIADDVGPANTVMLLFGTFHCCPGESLWVITELPGDLVPENDTLLSVLGPTGIEEGNNNPATSLSATPGHKSISIGYTLDKDDFLTLCVYDACGRLVRLLDSGHYKKGNYGTIWDCADETGNAVGTGTYFIRLRTGSVNLTRKVVLLD